MHLFVLGTYPHLLARYRVHAIENVWYTFVIVERNVHGVSAYTDGSEAPLGVGIIIRAIEELERILGHIILRVCVAL